MSSIIKRHTNNNDAIVTVGKVLETPKDGFVNIQLGKEVLSSANTGADEIKQKAQKEANELLESAKQEANALIQSAQEQINQMQAQVDAELNAKKEQLETQLQQQRDDANKFCNNIRLEAEQEKAFIIQSAEGEVVDLITTLLSYIVSHELSSNSKWVKYIIKKILNNENVLSDIEIGLPSEVFVNLSEEDKKYMENLTKSAKIVERLDLEGYTCIISTDNGDIIYNPEETLMQVKKDLLLLKQIGEQYD